MKLFLEPPRLRTLITSTWRTPLFTALIACFFNEHAYAQVKHL